MDTATRITERQREVLHLIAAGLTNEEIGDLLGITARAVKAHSDTLRAKLQVAHRRELPMAYRRLTGRDPLAPYVDERLEAQMRSSGA